jgi:hypothetical protein
MTPSTRHVAFRLGLFALLIVLMPMAAPAQTDEHLLLDSWDPGQRISGDSNATVFDGGKFRADQSNVRLDEGETEARARLMETYDLNPSIGLDWQWMNMRDADHPVPGQLNDLSLAFASPIAQSGPWFAITTLGGGYCGDGAFADDRAWYGLGSFGIGRQFSSGADLLLLIDYDGSGGFMPDVPQPAAEFRSRFGPTLEYVVGLPESSLSWKPNEKFDLELTYDLLNNVQVQAQYNLTKQFALLAGYDRNEQAFADSQLPTDRRLLFIEQRVEAGVRYDPIKAVNIDLGVGYGFGQRFATGFDDRSLTNVTTITDRAYVRAAVTFAF